MTRILAFVFIVLFSLSAWGSDAMEEPETIFLDEDVEDLSQFIWIKRPVIVFADSPNDPQFRQQMEYLRDREAELAERDVIVLTDTNPSEPSPLRLLLRPRGFMLVLIGKDGGIKLRKPFPWSVREIGRSIDKMPLRQREIRERKEGG
ncbi:MAG: DUF4174 domain-containing protein [Pseudomonadota bacterium]